MKKAFRTIQAVDKAPTAHLFVLPAQSTYDEYALFAGKIPKAHIRSFLASLFVRLFRHYKAFKMFTCIVAILGIIMFCGSCGNKDLVEMSRIDTDDYAAVAWEDRVYLPYCAVENSARGGQIGFVGGDKNDKIYEFKGYSPSEWIISYYDSGLMDGSMLMKEENVKSVPEGLTSEYAWNN